MRLKRPPDRRALSLCRHLVMRGLDPRIHQNETLSRVMDCRVELGNDSGEL
jgi:hypothetical protein